MRPLEFKGCSHFRQRLVCSTLSGKSIVITDIRAGAANEVGLQDFEASFLRLLERITNGCIIEINETGTELRYKPGVLTGGTHTHDCGTSRPIGWFLEGLVGVAPFCKKPLAISLTGITNASSDLSVDVMRTVTLPQLSHFGIEDGLELKIAKRGAPPLGGGLVLFKCPAVRALTPINLTEEGLIRRIRGIAYSTRMNPQTSNRMVESARGSLNPFVSDVYIYTDHYKGLESGLSPGFALSLVAESTTGVLLSAAVTGGAGELPEDIGTRTAHLLACEIANRGCVDTSTQSLMLLFMALCEDNVSRIRLGRLTEYSIQYLRHLRDFFGVQFKIQPDRDNHTVMLTCMGVGFKNVAKASF